MCKFSSQTCSTSQHYWCLHRCASFPSCHEHLSIEYDHRWWLFNLVFIKMWIVLFLFSPEALAWIASINILKCALARSQHTFSLQSIFSPSEMSSGPEKSAELLDIVDTRLWICIVQFYLTFAGAATQCIHWQWFCWKCSWVNIVISITVWCWFFMQCHLRGWGTQELIVVPSCCERFVKLWISLLLLTIFLVLSTVDGEIFRFLVIALWKRCSWTAKVFIHTVVHKVNNLTPTLPVNNWAAQESPQS